MTNIKQYLQTYSYLNSLYLRCENNSTLRESILTDKILPLDTLFYAIHLSQKEEDNTLREWTAPFLTLSPEEAMVWKHEDESLLHTEKRWSMRLKAPIEVCISPISLEEVLNDEDLIKRLSKRIKHITPYSVAECEEAREDDEIVWFIDGLDTYHLIRRGNEIVYPACVEGEKLPIEFSNYHYGIIQNSEGKCGIIDFKTRRVHLECCYEQIILENPLVQCAVMIPDSRESLLDIPAVLIDLESLENISTTSIYATLDYDRCFIEKSEDGTFRLCRFDSEDKIVMPLGRWYGEIMCDGHEGLRAVRDAQSGLYGYIDKNGTEVIACTFHDWNFFNFGHAILEVDKKAFVIDKTGGIIVPALYDEIELNKEGYFVVREGEKWGVYQGREMIIPLAHDEIIGSENDCFYIRDGEQWAVYEGNKMIVPFEECGVDPYSQLLRKRFEYYEAFRSQRHAMLLREYIDLFPSLRSQNDLMFAGLWGARVQVKPCEIIERYQELLSEPTQGRIGWDYPVSGDIFDMEIEMPVVFERIDGASVSLGIKYENLELLKPKEGIR